MPTTKLAPASTSRLAELDSLRGLAALTVVFSHFQILWLDEAMARSSHLARRLFWYSSDLFSSGHEAVILFFILSGFVLSIPAVYGNPQPYPVFITRRIFRIYLPYLGAIALALLGRAEFHGHIMQSTWIHEFWEGPISTHGLWKHFGLIGGFDTTQLDPPVWSLVFEMRVSLVFPALCALALKLKPARSLLFAAVLCAGSVLLIDIFQLGKSGSYLILTIDYAGIFVVGIYLARQRQRIAEFYHSFSRVKKIAAAILAAAFYVYGGALFVIAMQKHPNNGIDLAAPDWFTAVGAAGLIGFSLNSTACRRILLWPPIHLLGKISYSLYLLHFIVLLVLLHLLYGKIPLLVIFALCLAISIAASWLYYRAVEVPCMSIGRRISSRWLPATASR
jgi:peptidoglycan/LPS O-acetylase OafA/YrhL